ncbi:MAG: cytochrome c3 family protein [Methanocella sp.]
MSTRRASWLAALSLAGLVLASAAGVQGASIVGSKHDLAWGYHRVDEGFHSWDDYNQVCVFCHTPHGANQSQGALWNRQAPTGPYTLYQSGTLEAIPGQPGRSSLICLSCHDGSLAVDLVIRKPLYGTGTTFGPPPHGAMTTSGSSAWVNCGVDCHQVGSGQGHDATLKYLSTDLSNDHPVGIAYSSSTRLNPAPPGGKFVNGVRLIDNKVECISCHDPHDPTYAPFLVTSDNQSALCYTCHNK